MRAVGFGIPVLAADARRLMDAGMSREDAVRRIAHLCELRSEAIEALHIALQTPLENYIGSLGLPDQPEG